MLHAINGFADMSANRAQPNLLTSKYYPTPLPLRAQVPILSAPAGSMPRSIIENSAITLGRVAWICPAALAPHLGHFCGAWCGALRSIRDDVEKVRCDTQPAA